MSVETVDCPHCAEAGEISPTCSCEGTGTVDVDSLDERAAELEAFDSSGDDDYAWEYAEAGLEARFDLIDAAEMPEVA